MDNFMISSNYSLLEEIYPSRTTCLWEILSTEDTIQFKPYHFLLLWKLDIPNVFTSLEVIINLEELLKFMVFMKNVRRNLVVREYGSYLLTSLTIYQWLLLLKDKYSVCMEDCLHLSRHWMTSDHYLECKKYLKMVLDLIYYGVILMMLQLASKIVQEERVFYSEQ